MASALAADLGPFETEEPEAEPALNYPFLEGSFVFELENDYVFSAEDDSEVSDTFNTTELALDFRFSRIFSLHTDLVFEPVLDLEDDRFFEDHGFFVETLHLQADFDNLSLYGGKINPAFGTAWDVTPGIYGVDLAEDYEITERIGFGGSYTFGGDGIGEHTFNAAVFFADTSVLSNSLITRRGQVSESDGGASNTESLESFALALDGSDIESLPGFSYHLGFRFQSEGEGPDDVDDETGFVVGAVQEVALKEGLDLTLNGEVAYFDNFNGENIDNLYGTIGAAIAYEKWFADAAFTVRDISDNGGGGDFTDLQFQAGVGRELFEKASLQVGYRFLREQDIDTHTIGTFFVYETDFKFAKK